MLGVAAVLVVLFVVRATRPVDVVGMPVVRGRAVDAIYATGTVEAERRVTVKSRVAGPVATLDAREGDAVKSGAVLARISNPAAAFDLRRGQVEAAAASGSTGPRIAATQARIAAIDSQLAAAKREQERVDGLVRSGSLTTSDQDRARDRVNELAAQLAAARADLAAQQIDLQANAGRASAVVSALQTKVDDGEVRAPQDGMVMVRYVEPGEVVAVNQPLFKVGDVSSLLLEVAIDEADVARVHDGHDGAPASRVAASLHAFPGAAYRGTVVMILPDADREKKSYLAKVKLDEPPPGLRSGMTAEVNVIVTEREGVLLAPADAVKDGQVWLLSGDRAERRTVKLGIHDLLRAEVVGGLAEGDVVAVGGIELLEKGRTRVRVTRKEPDPLATAPGSAR